MTVSHWYMKSSLRFTQKSSFLFKAPFPIVQTVGMFENIHTARQVTHTYHWWEEGYGLKKKKKKKG